MVVVAAPPEGGGTSLDRVRETYPVIGTLKHAGLSGFQLIAGTSGCTIAEVEGPDNAGDFTGLVLAAGQELVFGQSITLLRLSTGAAVVYNSTERSAQWFVSSINGDDANNGLSDTSQFQTINKLMGYYIAAGDEIILGNGSVFNETLFLTTDDVTVRRSLPTGIMPSFTTMESLENSTFFGSGTLNVFQVNTLALEIVVGTENFASTAPTRWIKEDETFLTYRETRADVSTNPGSWTIEQTFDQWNQNGTFVFIHPLNSTDPTTDNKNYKISAREWAVIANGDGVAIDGVHVSDTSSANGGVIITGKSGTIKNCIIEGGTKHHATILEEDFTFQNNILWNAVPNAASNTGLPKYWTGGSTDFAGYSFQPRTGATGLVSGNVSYNNNSIAFYVHAGNVGQLFSEITYEDNFVVGAFRGFDSDHRDSFIATRNYCENCTNGIAVKGSASLDGFMSINHTSGGQIIQGSPDVSQPATTIINVGIVGDTFISSGSIISGNRLNVSKVSTLTGNWPLVYTDTNKGGFGFADGDIRVTASIFDQIWMYDSRQTIPQEIDDNLYWNSADPGGDLIRSRVAGNAELTTLASRQTESPTLDQNSINTNPLWSGNTVNGNLSLDPTSPARANGRDWGSDFYVEKVDWTAHASNWGNKVFSIPLMPSSL